MRRTTLALLPVAVAALAACRAATPPPAPPPPVPPPPAAAPKSEAPAASTPAPPPKPSFADVARQTVHGMVDAFNAHDAQKIAGFFTDDAVVASYGSSEMRGRSDLATALGSLFAAFPDAKLVLDRMWIVGEGPHENDKTATAGRVAVVEQSWAGTMSGDWKGTKATKRPVSQYRVRVLFFTDDGLVKEMHEYADGAGVMAQAQGKKDAPPQLLLPTNPPQVHVASGTPEEAKLAEWAKASDAAFDKDDPKAAAATMADDGDYWINIGGGPAMKGRKELLKGLAAWFEAIPDQKWTTANAWGVDGYAIVEHAVSGTDRGPLGPVRASRKPVSAWHWIDIEQPSADGKVQHGWGYANLEELLEETGRKVK